MEIVVTEMPKYPEHCLFIRHNFKDNTKFCLIDEDACEDTTECPYLVKLEEA